MKPKEKAKQLYDKMKFETEFNSQPSTVNVMCKKLALVCVNEIQENAQIIETEYEGYNNSYQYFLQVKLEISLL
jgi:hypothetical protein